MTDTEERLWSRRAFVKTALAGAAAGLIVRIDQAANPVPSVLDHVILGIDDLDRGIGWMEEHAGVRPVFGGVHPGRGTRNALLSLGSRRYLEIMAPDPQQASQNWYEEVRTLREPRLVGWFAHTENIAALARRALAAGFAIEGPKDGSRTRPDGKTLLWKSFRLKDNRGGLLPFFIEWSSDSLHPSEDAPKGCRLTNFGGLTPNTGELTKIANLLQLDLSFSRGDQPALRATIVGPKGELHVTS